MEARQAYLFRHRNTTYECVNPDCFMCGTFMGVNEVNFKQAWIQREHQAGSLELIPVCVSCHEEVLFWHDEDRTDAHIIGDVR